MQKILVYVKCFSFCGKSVRVTAVAPFVTLGIQGTFDAKNVHILTKIIVIRIRPY
jgi:hypothetical protein